VLKKLKFFYFSDSSLDYQEVKFFKTKTFFFVFVMGFAFFASMLVTNFLFGDPLGLSQKSDLIAENRTLKTQLRELAEKSGEIQKSIDKLVEQNNELRVMVDLGTIDSDTRKASVGGSLSGSEFAFLSSEAGSVLDESRGILTQLEREVDLQKKSYKEITKQYQANKALFAHMPAIKPCEGPYSINGFGMRIHPVLGVWRMHEGLDIINEVGVPVYAAGDATVFFAGRTQGGYGSVVELSHGYGYTTLYAHLSEILVHEGQQVKRGELIGKIGRSGLVSGPHLHYEVRLNGRKHNPVDYFFDDIEAARYRTLLARAK
jgi:murein DD-endopeptidase MepM/ murein hydrolase activator NlpD